MDSNKPHGPAGLPPSMRPRPGHQMRPTAAPQAAPSAPRPPQHPPVPPKSKAKTLAAVAIVIIALVMVGGATYRAIQNYSTNSAVKSGRYQAVFLTGNLWYFGKLTDLDKDFVKLSDIYYFQIKDQTTPTTQQNQTPQVGLVKLGNELHAPDDTMYINKKDMLFWENLKDDGKVVQAIKDYKSKNGIK